MFCMAARFRCLRLRANTVVAGHLRSDRRITVHLRWQRQFDRGGWGWRRRRRCLCYDLGRRRASCVHALASGGLAYAQDGVALRVVDGHLIVVAALLLEADDLFAATLFDHLRYHARVGHGGRADSDVLLDRDQTDLADLDGGSRPGLELLNLHDVARRDAMLFAGLRYRVD